MVEGLCMWEPSGVSEGRSALHSCMSAAPQCRQWRAQSFFKEYKKCEYKFPFLTLFCLQMIQWFSACLFYFLFVLYFIPQTDLAQVQSRWSASYEYLQIPSSFLTTYYSTLVISSKHDFLKINNIWHDFDLNL